MRRVSAVVGFASTAGAGFGVGRAGSTAGAGVRVLHLTDAAPMPAETHDERHSPHNRADSGDGLPTELRPRHTRLFGEPTLSRFPRGSALDSSSQPCAAPLLPQPSVGLLLQPLRRPLCLALSCLLCALSLGFFLLSLAPSLLFGGLSSAFLLRPSRRSSSSALRRASSSSACRRASCSAALLDEPALEPLSSRSLQPLCARLFLRRARRGIEALGLLLGPGRSAPTSPALRSSAGPAK